jgi:precorrin-2 dehydrogenase / sirohydrochlorin ferrochelatase
MSVIDYPVTLRLKGRRVLVVGGGKIALQRAADLLAAHASVRLIAPQLNAPLAAHAKLEWVVREYQCDDVRGFDLVFVATDEKQVSEQVVAEARALNIWANAADIPELCDFTMPSVGRKGCITLAVSSEGRAPAVAALVQRQLLRQVTASHVQLVRLVSFLRTLKPSGAARMKFIRDILSGEVGQKLLSGDRVGAFQKLRAELTR